MIRVKSIFFHLFCLDLISFGMDTRYFGASKLQQIDLFQNASCNKKILAIETLDGNSEIGAHVRSDSICLDRQQSQIGFYSSPNMRNMF